MWSTEPNGKFAGFAIRHGSTGELRALAVLPDFEGTGIGSRLLLLTEDWMRSKGCGELWLKTNPDQKVRASHFYRHNGWTDPETINGELIMKEKPAEV